MLRDFENVQVVCLWSRGPGHRIAEMIGQPEAVIIQTVSLVIETGISVIARYFGKKRLD